MVLKALQTRIVENLCTVFIALAYNSKSNAWIHIGAAYNITELKGIEIKVIKNFRLERTKPQFSIILDKVLYIIFTSSDMYTRCTLKLSFESNVTPRYFCGGVK